MSSWLNSDVRGPCVQRWPDQRLLGSRLFYRLVELAANTGAVAYNRIVGGTESPDHNM